MDKRVQLSNSVPKTGNEWVMPKLNPTDYTFSDLAGGLDRTPCRSLCYLVGLVDSAAHKISDVLPAKQILSWLYDCEEQSLNAEHLKHGENFFTRYFPGGYYPQTPCMVTKAWSPISAMLERGFEPEILNRDSKPILRVATGIWRPQVITGAVGIESAKTVEELFWAIMAEVSRRAMNRKMWVSIIAQPGWSYDAAIGSLPSWPAEEVAKAGRILWKRTPEG